jgi:hypothetical protein
MASSASSSAIRLLRGRQLGLLSTSQASNQTPVDAILAAPHVDHVLADPQIAGHVSDAAPGLDKIYNLPSEPTLASKHLRRRSAGRASSALCGRCQATLNLVVVVKLPLRR